MVKAIFNQKINKNNFFEILARELDLQRVQTALELENIRKIDKKLDEIMVRLANIERMLHERSARRVGATTNLSNKTKELIKLVLQKKGELTPRELGKLIGLSRTRCNEYLKEMEREGILTSKKIGRRKFYSLRQK